MKRAIAAASLAATLATAAPATAQLEPLDTFPRPCAEVAEFAVAAIGGPGDDYARIAEIAGASPIRPRLARRISDTPTVLLCRDDALLPWTSRHATPRERAGPHVELLRFGTDWELNTAYPDDRNNGPVWAGKGLSGGVEGGVRFRWGPLTAALAPTLVWQQNDDFEIRDLVFQPDTTRPPILSPPPALSPYANPYYLRAIDLPQRFGEDSFSAVDLGGSYLRLDAGGFAAGVAKENLWWGPGRRNALLMTNTAAGFPHAFAGTSRPVDIGIGRLDAEAVWGQLDESDYFDDIPGNGNRLLTAVLLTYEPRWIPGLFLGLARSFVFDLDGTRTFGDYIPFFGGLIDPGEVTDTGEQIFDEENELLSLYLRWVLPESGFEVYGEWARDDAAADFEDLVEEPDHSQAYLLGLQKVIPAGRRLVRLAAEVAHLQENRPTTIARSTAVLYTHSFVRQGYTHRGQLLGAGIGPGSDSQYLAADVLGAWGSIGIFGERIRRDEMSAVAIEARREWEFEHDVELGIGVRQLILLDRFDLEWGLTYNYRYNRNFLEDQANWTLRLGLGWKGAVLGRATASDPLRRPGADDR